MKRTLYFFAFMLLLVSGVRAQTLSAGDIAFIGVNEDSGPGIKDHSFTWIALTDIPAGEVIYFTENGWSNDNTLAVDPTYTSSGFWIGGSEGHFSWTAPAGGLPRGSIVHMYETGSDVMNVSGGGTVSSLIPGTGWNLLAGDQVLAYQSSAGPRPNNVVPNFIAGIHIDDSQSSSIGFDSSTGWSSIANGGSSSHVPPGLTNGVDCIALFNPNNAADYEQDNVKYKGTLVGTACDIRAAINSSFAMGAGNWNADNSTAFDITPTGYATASITNCVGACAITASITAQTNVDCNGNSSGAMTVTQSGGSANYSYVWSNGSTTTNTASSTNSISSLHAGTYTVTITDANGCTATASSTVTQPTVLSASTGSTMNVTCNGGSNGSASSNATGGLTPYTYLWSNGATTSSVTGISAGTYTVTVTDDNGCTSTASTTITEPTALTASTTLDKNVSCNGGSDGELTGSGSGGSSSYTYSWSNGGTTASQVSLPAGTYTVTITDNNGCTATSSKTITSPAALDAGEIQ